MKVLVALCLLCGFCFAQDEPIKFRGAYLGEPLSAFVDCSSGKPKALNDDFKPHGKLCEGRSGVITHVQVHSSFLKAPTTEGEQFFFDDKKIVKVKIYIPDTDWDKVRSDLSAKLGEPTSEPPQVFQNGFGARWEYDQGFWHKGDIVAYAGIKANAVGSHIFTHGIEITITEANASASVNSLD
jgi:hypothetical protein